MNGISVVVACYNLGRTVRESVDSAHAQTRPLAELVIVDDGSKDPYTLQVLSELEAKGVCVVFTPHRGVAWARKLGVQLTSAPYVVFLHADDVLEPEYCEHLGKRLDSNPELQFVTCGVGAFGEASYVWIPPSPTWIDTLVRGGPHISTMFRRDMWNMLGGFDDQLPGYEDTEFWLSALEKGCKGEVIDEPLLRYRVRRGSRYHRAIGSKRFVQGMQQIYVKHWPTVGERFPEVLASKASFVAEQETHQRALQNQCASLERQIAESRKGIDRALETLRIQGKEPLDWGDVRQLAAKRVGVAPSRITNIEHYYLNVFLNRNRDDISGRVGILEGPDDINGVGTSAAYATTTRITDLMDESIVSGGTFDCLLILQELQAVADVETTLRAAYKALAPGGVLLCTMPCLCRPLSTDAATRSPLWGFTPAAARWLFAKVFPPEAFEVIGYGNVMTMSASLLGLSPANAPDDELNAVDPSFPVICCVRAVKPRDSSPRRRFRISAIADTACTTGIILFYHRVAELTPDPHGLCVTPANFCEQMKYLREAYHPVSLDELVWSVAEGRASPGSVAITFDDGYLDCLTTASPVLQEFEVPATFFVTTESLDQRHEFWWDVLARIFLSPSSVPDYLDLYNDRHWVKSTRTIEERATAHQSLVEILYAASAADRDSILNRVTEWSRLDLSPRDTHRPMTEDELRELAERSGHSIGAHTVHHLSLPRQTAELQAQEVRENHQSLEHLLGRRVAAFSYPYGEFNRTTMQAVQKTGIRFAVTVEARAVRPGLQPLLLPRIEVKNCDALTLGEQLRLLSV